MGAPGEKLSAETRAKIGAAARKRYLERLKNAPKPLPQKPCSKCRKVKPLRDFYIRRKKLKSGLLSEIPDSWCKECTIRVQGERWARMKQEGVDTAAMKRRHYENEDAAKRRERRREYLAIQRRKEGIPVRPLRHRREPRGELLSLAPLAGLLEKELPALAKARNEFLRPGGPNGYESKGLDVLAERSGLSRRRIHALLNGEYSHVRLSTVDKILCALGLPHLLHELYPEKEKAPSDR